MAVASTKRERDRDRVGPLVFSAQPDSYCQGRGAILCLLCRATRRKQLFDAPELCHAKRNPKEPDTLLIEHFRPICPYTLDSLLSVAAVTARRVDPVEGWSSGSPRAYHSLFFSHLRALRVVSVCGRSSRFTKQGCDHAITVVRIAASDRVRNI